ncbi:hypothetical protein WAF17_04945 [Bernardetia sp. ABR2-2B]|uniref:hypothetical protein n=1 Tax=Bernardetia sp. ABR2-2B TaxID=3127472 RepID=UPI0030D53A4D
MIRNFNYFGVAISIVGLIILFYDFSLANEFMLEGSYVIALSFIVLINSFRLLHPKLSKNIEFTILTNIVLLICLSYNLWTLFWLSWGRGYFGIETPSVYDLAFLIHSIMILFLMIEFVTFIKNRN